MENTFRHSYTEESSLLVLQRVDKDDFLIVKDTFSLRHDEQIEIFMTLLKTKNPYFRTLAKNFLIGENEVRENHNPSHPPP